MSQQFYFKDENTLVSYLKWKIPYLSKVKLNKTMYLLWAYYAASYGQMSDYPKYLFNDEFIAQHYGPVLQNLIDIKVDDIEKRPLSVESDRNYDIKMFVDNIAMQVADTYDFTLIVKTWHDKAVTEAKENGIMNKDTIISEYIDKLAEQSAN